MYGANCKNAILKLIGLLRISVLVSFSSTKTVSAFLVVTRLLCFWRGDAGQGDW